MFLDCMRVSPDSDRQSSELQRNALLAAGIGRLVHKNRLFLGFWFAPCICNLGDTKFKCYIPKARSSMRR